MAFADDLKALSPKMKILLVVALFSLIAAADWLYLLQPSLEERGVLKTKLTDLEREVSEKERIASQKERFIKEVRLLKEAFLLALNKLPDQREIPGLFQAVSVAGKEAHMEFQLFEPKPPEKKPDVKDNLKPSDQRAEAKPPGDKKGTAKPPEPDRFYEEIPVKVTVNGDFNHVVYFFNKVSKLPRIINIEDIVIGEGKGTTAKARVISTSCVVKTYMFVEKKEDGTQKPNEKKK